MSISAAIGLAALGHLLWNGDQRTAIIAFIVAASVLGWDYWYYSNWLVPLSAVGGMNENRNC